VQAGRAATLERFRRARYGLFLHYGVYSLLGRGEWVQFRETIPVAAYGQLIDRFTAARFDAGPLGDGSLHPGDAATLREVGRRVRQANGGTR
jgi:alpha-L-fucosidase